MNQMKQRAMRRWLTEIGDIVKNPAIDPYSAYTKIKQKFESAQPTPKPKVKKISFDFSEIDGMLLNSPPTHVRIQAIKKYREKTKCGLLEAKIAIEDRIKTLASQPRRRSHRAKFRQTQR